MNAPPLRHPQRYLGIDPGRSKCGFAIVLDDGARESAEVVATAEIGDRIEREVRRGGVQRFCIGHATSSGAIVDLCAARWPEIPRSIVDETNTTLEARALYFADHPPKGLWRFIPRGLLVPKEPLDGYAAVLIVERFRRAQGRT